MKRLYGTVHRLGDPPSVPPADEGWVIATLVSAGVVALSTGAERLLVMTAAHLQGLYAGQEMVIPGGRVLRLHANPGDADGYSLRYEQSLERMLAELDEITAAAL